MSVEVRYTEKFLSVQGEAMYTGKLCTWLRLFGCSLQCKGFGQKEPGNPETWVEQRAENFDAKMFQSLVTIPTPSTGCDSDYSWSAKFKHLVAKDDAIVVARQLREMLNGYGHATRDKIGHVFTGGEPMLQQEAIAEIIHYWIDAEDCPAWVGIETNATRHIKPVLRDAIKALKDQEVMVYFSMSPKLLHVAGEQPSKAIKHDIMIEYLDLCPHSYLKFVLNEDERAWEQASKIHNAIVSDDSSQYQYWHDPDIWVMPVGGVVNQQLDPAVGRIADRAIRNGWNVSPRTHILMWGDDQIGR